MKAIRKCHRFCFCDSEKRSGKQRDSIYRDQSDRLLSEILIWMCLLVNEGGGTAAEEFWSSRRFSEIGDGFLEWCSLISMKMRGSIAYGDFDADGRMDMGARNWGINLARKASPMAPLRICFGETEQRQGVHLEAYFDSILGALCRHPSAGTRPDDPLPLDLRR
ncbi:MAG: hypothetical protein M2R45_00062 [Verrucomicrobia subdivision 3 bacterium]|nr:hypothetical protein [Limisphaerales bacterium]MCS1412479.1 hypothetical protein [Limisphaerales bacterium]